jgi:undecaprenyl pyrophosphate phosphatase UppP
VGRSVERTAAEAALVVSKRVTAGAIGAEVAMGARQWAACEPGVSKRSTAAVVAGLMTLLCM